LIGTAGVSSTAVFGEVRLHYGEFLWGKVASDLATVSISRAGHWLGDENPEATAAALMEFFRQGI
jgi:hypothetical protein